MWSDDGTHKLASVVMDWLDRLDAASTKFGKPMNIAGSVRPWMEGEGFVNVSDDMFKVGL